MASDLSINLALNDLTVWQATHMDPGQLTELLRRTSEHWFGTICGDDAAHVLPRTYLGRAVGRAFVDLVVINM